jgi:hypothetical protein
MGMVVEECFLSNLPSSFLPTLLFEITLDFSAASCYMSSFNSFNLKIANFKAIAGQGGLANYTRQSVQVYEKYSKMSDSKARLAGNEISTAASCGVSKRGGGEPPL